jgi:type I restriction enzyme S subunit
MSTNIEIHDSWKAESIGNLIESKGIAVGVMYPGQHTNDGIPLIKSGDISDGKINENLESRISKDVNDNYSRTQLLGGELLVVLVGNPGLSVVVPKHLKGWNVARAVSVLKLKNKENAQFVSYALQSREVRHNLLSYCNTTVQITLNLKELKEVFIPWPSKPEREEIVRTLDSFNAKIELLQAQNKTLETMAQTIFKEWFGKYQIEDELPKGWRVGKLGDVIDLQSGFSHNTKVSGDTKVKIAKMGVVDGKNFFNRRSVINYSETIDSKYKLKEDDIIVSTRDVTRDKLIIGNVSLIPDDLANFGLYAGSNTWIIKTDLNQYYLFLLLRNRNFRHHIIQSSKGSTIVMITRDAFLNCPLIFPHENVLLEFINTIDPIFKKIKNNNSTIQSLTKTRDTLLPKLMSGQVRVNNVKQTADA